MTQERFAVILIVSHLAAATLHGVAHGMLDVPAGGPMGLLLVAVAVYIAPLVALVGLLKGQRVTAALVMSVSMGTALTYGLIFHYFLRTPDHVAHAPAGLWGDIFRSTAAVIAVVEACGLAAGALLILGGDGRRVSVRA